MKNTRLKKFLAVSVITSCIVIAGCKHPSASTETSDISLMQSLQQQQVQVIAYGERMRLVLPSDDFFTGESTSVNADKITTLGQIAALIKEYPRSPVRITGYSDNVGGETALEEKTTQQAETIAAYLWANGISYEQLKVAGAGEKQTVSSNLTVTGNADNRRVEILIN